MKLTPAQEKAIRLSAPALQILACAGSGKTEVMARRVVQRLLEGVPADAIVAFTFTTKAASELKERIERRAAEADKHFARLPPSAAGLFVGTVHSYCLHVLQSCGGDYELFDPLPEEREWALLHRFGRRLGLVDLMMETWPGQQVSVRKAAGTFARSLAVVHNERIRREVLREKAPAFAAAVERYEHLLEGMQLVSFDQMIEMACRELSPGGRLRTMLSGRVREVFVDEYQDLNRAQEEVLRSLVELGAVLTVVGDDDQAIYQWRGGDVSIFLGFPNRYEGSQRESLDENHRSVEPIVTVSREFIGTLPPERRVQKSMRPVRKDIPAAIELVAAGTPQDEAEVIAKRVCRLLENGHNASEVAVLYRSVRSSAKPLIDVLRREGISCAPVGRLSLLDRPAMALMARIFVLWAGGTWQPDEEREVVTPEQLATDMADLTGVDLPTATRTVSQLEQMGKDIATGGTTDLVGTYMEILKLIGLPTEGIDRPRQERGLGQLSELLADFEHAQRRATPAKWLRPPVPSAAEEVAEDKAVLGSLAEEGEKVVALPRSPGEIFLARLRVFLEEFASSAVEEAPDSPTLDQEAVNILTIHKSKGLEFPIVFVPSLVERRFPTSKMGKQQQWYIPSDLFDQDRYQGREDDERRLFYVAMTRARDLLVLSFFTRYPSGRATSPSRFVQDLPKLPGKLHLKKIGQCRPPVFLRPPAQRPMIETDFGQLLTFSECSYKYYLRHVCDFQPRLAFELGFGKMLHHVVAELARRAQAGTTLTVEDVKELLQRADYLPFAGPVLHEKLLKSARRRLTSFVLRYGRDLTRTIAPERPFEVPMDFARIVGRIDLLLRAEGGGERDVELRDFKTAVNRPPSEHHRNQLRLYAEAARVLGLNPVRLVIHDLDADTGGQIDVEEDEESKSRFKGQLRQWLENIRAGRFSPNPKGKSCPSCDFRLMCPR